MAKETGAESKKVQPKPSDFKAGDFILFQDPNNKKWHEGQLTAEPVKNANRTWEVKIQGYPTPIELQLAPRKTEQLANTSININGEDFAIVVNARPTGEAEYDLVHNRGSADERIIRNVDLQTIKAWENINSLDTQIADLQTEIRKVAARRRLDFTKHLRAEQAKFDAIRESLGNVAGWSEIPKALVETLAKDSQKLAAAMRDALNELDRSVKAAAVGSNTENIQKSGAATIMAARLEEAFKTADDAYDAAKKGEGKALENWETKCKAEIRQQEEEQREELRALDETQKEDLRVFKLAASEALRVFKAEAATKLRDFQDTAKEATRTFKIPAGEALRKFKSEAAAKLSGVKQAAEAKVIKFEADADAETGKFEQAASDELQMITGNLKVPTLEKHKLKRKFLQDKKKNGLASLKAEQRVELEKLVADQKDELERFVADQSREAEIFTETQKREAEIFTETQKREAEEFMEEQKVALERFEGAQKAARAEKEGVQKSERATLEDAHKKAKPPAIDKPAPSEDPEETRKITLRVFNNLCGRGANGLAVRASLTTEGKAAIDLLNKLVIERRKKEYAKDANHPGGDMPEDDSRFEELTCKIINDILHDDPEAWDQIPEPEKFNLETERSESIAAIDSLVQTRLEPIKSRKLNAAQGVEKSRLEKNAHDLKNEILALKKDAPTIEQDMADIWDKLGKLEVDSFKLEGNTRELAKAEAEATSVDIPGEVIAKLLASRHAQVTEIMHLAYNGADSVAIKSAVGNLFTADQFAGPSNAGRDELFANLRRAGIKSWDGFLKQWERLSGEIADSFKEIAADDRKKEGARVIEDDNHRHLDWYRSASGVARRIKDEFAGDIKKFDQKYGLKESWGTRLKRAAGTLLAVGAGETAVGFLAGAGDAQTGLGGAAGLSMRWIYNRVRGTGKTDQKLLAAKAESDKKYEAAWVKKMLDQRLSVGTSYDRTAQTLGTVFSGILREKTKEHVAGETDKERELLSDASSGVRRKYLEHKNKLLERGVELREEDTERMINALKLLEPATAAIASEAAAKIEEPKAHAPADEHGHADEGGHSFGYTRGLKRRAKVEKPESEEGKEEGEKGEEADRRSAMRRALDFVTHNLGAKDTSTTGLAKASVLGSLVTYGLFVSGIAVKVHGHTLSGTSLRFLAGTAVGITKGREAIKEETENAALKRINKLVEDLRSGISELRKENNTGVAGSRVTPEQRSKLANDYKQLKKVYLGRESDLHTKDEKVLAEVLAGAAAMLRSEVDGILYEADLVGLDLEQSQVPGFNELWKKAQSNTDKVTAAEWRALEKSLGDVHYYNQAVEREKAVALQTENIGKELNKQDVSQEKQAEVDANAAAILGINNEYDKARPAAIDLEIQKYKEEMKTARKKIDDDNEEALKQIKQEYEINKPKELDEKIKNLKDQIKSGDANKDVDFQKTWVTEKANLEQQIKVVETEKKILSTDKKAELIRQKNYYKHAKNVTWPAEKSQKELLIKTTEQKKKHLPAEKQAALERQQHEFEGRRDVYSGIAYTRDKMLSAQKSRRESCKTLIDHAMSIGDISLANIYCRKEENANHQAAWTEKQYSMIVTEAKIRQVNINQEIADLEADLAAGKNGVTTQDIANKKLERERIFNAKKRYDPNFQIFALASYKNLNNYGQALGDTMRAYIKIQQDLENEAKEKLKSLNTFVTRSPMMDLVKLGEMPLDTSFDQSRGKFRQIPEVIVASSVNATVGVVKGFGVVGSKILGVGHEALQLPYTKIQAWRAKKNSGFNFEAVKMIGDNAAAQTRLNDLIKAARDSGRYRIDRDYSSFERVVGQLDQESKFLGEEARGTLPLVNAWEKTKTMSKEIAKYGAAAVVGGYVAQHLLDNPVGRLFGIDKFPSSTFRNHNALKMLGWQK